MEIFVLWIVFALIVAMIADGRGRSPVLWFVICLIASPLIGGVIVVLAPRVQKLDSARSPGV